MKVKKVYKFATGSTIPKDAVYLSTVTQTEEYDSAGWSKCRYVWHYFLVEAEEK